MSVNNFPATFDLATPSFIITDNQLQIEAFRQVYTQASLEVAPINPFKCRNEGNQAVREFVYVDTNDISDWASLNQEDIYQQQSTAFSGAIDSLFYTWSRFWIRAFQCPFVIVYDCRVDWFPADSSFAKPLNASYLRWTLKVLPYTIDPSLR